MTKEEKKEYQKAWREKNKERLKEKNKAWRDANRERLKAYRKTNKDKIAERNKAYYEVNKERLNEYRKTHLKERIKIDPLFRLKKNLRRASSRAWKGQSKNATTEKLLGCSYNDFKDYITAQFVGNMTWGNYGDVWHVDHITPLSVIKDVSQTELIESLCHFSNLQPLFAEDNISKKDKLDYEYPAIYKTNLLHNSNKK